MPKKPSDFIPEGLLDSRQGTPSEAFQMAAEAIEAGAPSIVLRMLKKGMVDKNTLRETDSFGMSLLAIAVRKLRTDGFIPSQDELLNDGHGWTRKNGMYLESFRLSGRLDTEGEASRATLGGLLIGVLLFSGSDPWLTWQTGKSSEKQAGASDTYRLNEGSILSDAMTFGQKNLVSLLFEHPQCPDLDTLSCRARRLTKRGKSTVMAPAPLLFALSQKPSHSKNLKIFLSKGADPNPLDVDGCTPLFHAYSPHTAAMLVEYGACPDRRNQDGKSVLQQWMEDACKDSELRTAFLRLWKQAGSNAENKDEYNRITSEVFNNAIEEGYAKKDILFLAGLLKGVDIEPETQDLGEGKQACYSPLTKILIGMGESYDIRGDLASRFRLLRDVRKRIDADPYRHIIVPGCTDADLARMMGASAALNEADSLKRGGPGKDKNSRVGENEDSEEGLSDAEEDRLLVRTLKAACALARLKVVNPSSETLVRTSIEFIQRCFLFANPPDIPSIELRGFRKDGVEGRAIENALRRIGAPGGDAREAWDTAAREAWTAALVLPLVDEESGYRPQSVSTNWSPMAFSNALYDKKGKGGNDGYRALRALSQLAAKRLTSLAAVYPDSDWGGMPLASMAWVFSTSMDIVGVEADLDHMVRGSWKNIPEKATLPREMLAREDDVRAVIGEIDRRLHASDWRESLEAFGEQTIPLGEKMLEQWRALLERALLNSRKNQVEDDLEKSAGVRSAPRAATPKKRSM